MTSDAERFFRETDYWKAWSQVPEVTADISYALAAVSPSDRCILDAPCGRGRLLRAIAERAPHARLVGADVNAEMVKQVPRAMPNAMVTVASVYGLPFDNRTFDTVLCHESFMHFDEPQAALAELCRVSRSRVYLSVTTRRQLNTALHRLGVLPRSEVPHVGYNREEIRAFLPLDFRWRITGAFLVGRKALRLTHRLHTRLHALVGRHVPQPILRTFGQTLFVYGDRVA